MRLLTWMLIVASSALRLSAQSQISRDSITPQWAMRHLIGGIDTPPPVSGRTWACVKSWPEVTRALIAVYEQSDSRSLVRADAILMLGATGQDSAFRFLIGALDAASPNDRFRQDMLLALGNSADPPQIVYDRLAISLTSGAPEDRSMAARSLSDIRSPKAEAVLRKAREGEGSVQAVAEIDRSLARFGNARHAPEPCDSTILAPDH
jgi:hypothetical protein